MSDDSPERQGYQSERLDFLRYGSSKHICNVDGCEPAGYVVTQRNAHMVSRMSEHALNATHLARIQTNKFELMSTYHPGATQGSKVVGIREDEDLWTGHPLTMAFSILLSAGRGS